jgi:hypothetical protein
MTISRTTLVTVTMGALLLMISPVRATADPECQVQLPYIQ